MLKKQLFDKGKSLKYVSWNFIFSNIITQEIPLSLYPKLSILFKDIHLFRKQ